MTFEQYAAQQAQATQQAPQQEALTVDQVAAKLDAERLSSLLAQMQAAIEEKTAPAAMLAEMTGAMFGSNSPQAATVAAIIDADKHPGGHEMAIADIRQRRKMLKQQAKQLEERAKAITEELARLDEAERALTQGKAAAAAMDAALTETLTFCRGMDPQRDMLPEIETLYTKYHGNPVAMGLLYGSLLELSRQGYPAHYLDLVQQQTFFDLKERIAATIKV